jgi:phage terminase large subunit
MTAIQATSTPIGFITYALGLSMYDWQKDAVARLELAGWGKPIVQISLLAPNEAGKSKRVVVGSGLYHVGVHPKGKVRITTKDQRQLNEQIIPGLEEQVHKFPYQVKRAPYYQITTPTGGRLIAYVTDDAARVEGMHGAPDEPFLDILDEAKSIPEAIFDASDRCGFQARIFSSSGGLEAGTFWKSHTVNRAQFHCVRAGLLDCPHISQEKIKRIIEKHGENAPFTRSCLFGEFMKQDDEDSYVVPHAAVMFALENPPRHKTAGSRIGFVDFAEGTAEHVLAVRDGNKTEIEAAFREANKHAACSRLIRAFMVANLKEDQIWGDAADKESLEILSSLGWNIHRKNFGAPSTQSEVYVSWGAEAWHETGIGISTGQLIVPNDDILIAQLTSRKKTITGRGKLGIEEKYDMRKRGVESPDRADAFCGANNVYDYAQLQPTKQPFRIPPGYISEHQGYGEQSEEFADAMGAHTGI